MSSSRQLLLRSLWCRSCRRPSVHSDENRRSSQSHAHRFGRVQATVGVTGIRLALNWLVHWRSTLTLYQSTPMMENTSIAEVGVGTHRSSSWRRSSDTYIGRALSAKLQAENAGKCVIWSLKFHNFPGGACPGKKWSLQTTVLPEMRKNSPSSRRMTTSHRTLSRSSRGKQWKCTFGHLSRLSVHNGTQQWSWLGILVFSASLSGKRNPKNEHQTETSEDSHTMSMPWGHSNHVATKTLPRLAPRQLFGKAPICRSSLLAAVQTVQMSVKPCFSAALKDCSIVQ